MADMGIKAKIDKAPLDKEGQETSAKARVGVVYECTANLPVDLNEAIERWGAELTYNRMLGAVIIDLQSAMRTQIKKEDFSEESLQQYVSGWAPGLKKTGVSMETKTENYLATLDDDALEALMEKVRERQAETEAA